MLNFRKLKQDFSNSIIKEGRASYDSQKVVSVKLVHLDQKTMRVTGRVLGQYENCYESELEIDRIDCETVDSNCDCPYNYDCQHIAALLFFLEQNLDQVLAAYSKEAVTQDAQITDANHKVVSEEILQTLKEAESKEVEKREMQLRRELLHEYVTASHLLAHAPFFQTVKHREVSKAEFFSVITPSKEFPSLFEIQMTLRLPHRSKPLHVPHIKAFFESVRYTEGITISGKPFYFSLGSFSVEQAELMRMIMDHVIFPQKNPEDRLGRSAFLRRDMLGVILARAFELATQERSRSTLQKDSQILRSFYQESIDNALQFSIVPSSLQFHLEYISDPTAKLLIVPKIAVGEGECSLEEATLFECIKPGVLYKGTYYRFPAAITRAHLQSFGKFQHITIPQPLMGVFIEHSLPELAHYAEVVNEQVLNHFVTLPYTEPLGMSCQLSYLDGELEAYVKFKYGHISIPAASSQLTLEDIESFVSNDSILARDLVKEKELLQALFQDFVYEEDSGVYISKSEKRIVEFMTETLPLYRDKVEFHCPQNLLDQFIYDETQFSLSLKEHDNVCSYQIEFKVQGVLEGITTNQLWDCLTSHRNYIEQEVPRAQNESYKLPRIIVLDLDKIANLVQVLDEFNIVELTSSKIECPLWSLINANPSNFKGLPIKFSISPRLMALRKQILGEVQISMQPIPSSIQASLRSYQKEGVFWLERLRNMFLGGVLADDMGLGKTLQTIVAITQLHEKMPGISLIVCPTSLLYNWKEEFSKFNPALRVCVVDGTPVQRKKLILKRDCDIIVSSYTLIQKDIEIYQSIRFNYVALDEAQHIKNRGTRNAKSVKLLKSAFRLVLSGTPIENSLEEMWSLFDFLMPGFLSTFDRFVEKYVRPVGKAHTENLQKLRQKVAPFILRRMKSDVLADLPPLSVIVYHCQLSDLQKDLYAEYVKSARKELIKLVEKNGFERVQIQVLATLTRLKQICCHPAIFAKEKVEPGDSAKYDMLRELIDNLIEGGHRAVIFSQYTRMLQILSQDLQKLGIRFLYLDGSSKNRLELVKQFNNDTAFSLFLVSLKVGGTGLNLTGADTVIHYDMWWNPAIENQATDRVYRMGQKKCVSTYKLITLGTIEEKIAEMQERKKDLVQKVVSCDDEVVSKLTWEDVLELLKT